MKHIMFCYLIKLYNKLMQFFLTTPVKRLKPETSTQQYNIRSSNMS